MKKDDSDLGISVEVLGGLERAGINTCGRLRAASDEELLDIRGFGPKTLTSIHEAIHRMRQRPDADLLADHHPIARRNKTIVARARAETFGEIAESYGISVARVREIVMTARRSRA